MGGCNFIGFPRKMFKIIWVYAVSYYDGPFDGKKRRKHYIGVCSPCFILYPHSNPIRFFRGKSFAFSELGFLICEMLIINSPVYFARRLRESNEIMNVKEKLSLTPTPD